MRTACSIALVLIAAGVAQAHFYLVGHLEILHPAIIMPLANSDCTCAHVTIINHGLETEYFLGADIEVASNTKLLRIASHVNDFSALSEVAIAPGATLDLNRHEWCLFLSDVPKVSFGLSER